MGWSPKTIMTPKEESIEKAVDTPDTEDWEKEFIEKGADLEHTRWAKWQAYLHSKCVEHENGKGEWVCFPAELYRRWERQVNTAYEELSAQEKERDRKEVRSYLPLINQVITSHTTYWKGKNDEESYNRGYADAEHDVLERVRKVKEDYAWDETASSALDQILDNLK